MDVHNYSAETGEYINTTNARPDPLEKGRFLMPANSTTIAPPATGDNEVAVFENGAWVKKTDYRGTEYWTVTGGIAIKGKVKNIGETVPDGAVLSDPGNQPSSLHTWDGSAWVAPTEAEQLAAWRASATIPRDTFLQACVTGGIITQEVAEEAADGSWPAAFNTFLSGLTGAQRIQAKARWADAKDVRRNSDILALIAAYQSVSDATLDEMFGWEG